MVMPHLGLAVYILSFNFTTIVKKLFLVSEYEEGVSYLCGKRYIRSMLLT